MEIRKTTTEDISTLQDIFTRARLFMISTGNTNQWAHDYPSEQMLTEDIINNNSYVIIKNNTIVGTFVLAGGNDPTYSKIYQGAWKNHNPYATIHRIASNGTTKGIFTAALNYALQQYNTIRIDTHRDNKVMQHCLEKNGFEYCGIIHCWNGDERLAYQL